MAGKDGCIMTDRTIADRTFERIETLFDIVLFADVKVLIVGCGSGGASVALQLAMSGIRNFTLIDNDILGPENVIRHVCGRRYIGQKKVDAIADVLLDRNPKANIAKIDADIMSYPGLAAEIAKADVVVLATDNEPTRYTINEICVRESVPFVVGRVFTRGGTALVISTAPCEPRCRFSFVIFSLLTPSTLEVI
jgi:molybdopterin-synthase adenylyltransferase